MVVGVIPGPLACCGGPDETVVDDPDADPDVVAVDDDFLLLPHAAATSSTAARRTATLRHRPKRLMILNPRSSTTAGVRPTTIPLSLGSSDAAAGR
jgi:hypothetical protein